MSRLMLVGLLALVGQAFLPVQALADDAARKTKAVALIKQALPLQEAGHHDEALKLLDESWATFAHPKALFYKGRSLVALERWEDARVLYEQVKTSTRDLEPDKLAEVEANLTRCKAAIEARTPRTDQRVGSSEPVRPITVFVTPRAEPPMVGAEPEPRRSDSTARTWGWVLLGTGIASTGAGLGFLGNYTYQQSRDLAPNQRIAAVPADLGVGVALSAVGVGLTATAIWLLVAD